MNIVVGITGASGTIYARRLIERIATCGNHTINVVFSNYGSQVAKYEEEFEKITSLELNIYRHDEMFSSLASGSSLIDAMVIVPCSASTMSRIANGISDNLITRTADVMLKERRKLIIALRETPLSLIHIENMRSITLAGGVIMPLSPSFYSKPTSIIELIDTQCDRILSLLGVEGERYIFEPKNR